MKISGNTILIAGGVTGIGFALADAFSEAGNEVISARPVRRALCFATQSERKDIT
jgi:short-subunit dehydrogenase involved in D-alanine esterification of teichoic acids